jgi:predicted nucleic acid-binding protein
MRKVFVDTSAFVALFYKKDKNHLKAKVTLEKLKKENALMIILPLMKTLRQWVY